METEDGTKTMRGRGRGRGRGARGRGLRGARGGRGRGKKNVKITNNVEVEDSENVAPATDAETQDNPEVSEQSAPKEIDLEADISQLEAPTFTTINRGPPEPMLRLQWDHRVNLVAEKVLNPMIHCCDKCQKPILIYGRMIPCKHVFCLACGKREDKVCPRCKDKVTRVEQTGLGTVFMCTHGGTRYNSAGCRRTYLSQRDLQAHINHRHIAASSAASHGSGDAPPEPRSPVKISTMGSGAAPRLKTSQSIADPRVQSTPSVIEPHHRRGSSPPAPPPFVSHRPPIMYQGGTQSNMRTNLITVQIQDSGMDVPSTFHQPHYSHAPPPPQYAPTYTVPPPVTIPPPQPAQFYPNPPSSYVPPPGPQPPPQYGTGPPAPRPPHYQDPMAQTYSAPPPQWQHPPPNNAQQFYR